MLTPMPPPPPPVVPVKRQSATTTQGPGPRDLQSEIDAVKGVLKPTTVTVRLRDGTVFTESKSSEGEYVEFGERRNEERAQYMKDMEDGVSRLEPKEFSADSNRWLPSVSTMETECSTVLLERGLKLLSYNVWFDRRRKEERASALFAILEQEAADVVCLQEVTPEFVGWLRNEQWLQKFYVVSDPFGTTFTGTFAYGVLMLFRRGVIGLSSLTLHSLPTNMNRRALIARMKLPQDLGEFALCTVHLESMANTAMRMEQLYVILTELDREPSKCRHKAIMGDMNFDEGMTEENMVLTWGDGYVDSWKTENPAVDPSEGWTIAEGARIDRLFLSSKHFVPKSFRRLGMTEVLKPLPTEEHSEDAVDAQNPNRKVRFDANAGVDVPSRKKDLASLRPSDHFGIRCNLVLKT